MIQTMRIDDKIALVVEGRAPYTICRMTKWELVKLVFWSLFLCFALSSCLPNQDPWQWGLDANDTKISYYAFCRKYDTCSSRRSEIRDICRKQGWPLTKDKLEEYSPDYFKTQLECEKPK